MISIIEWHKKFIKSFPHTLKYIALASLFIILLQELLLFHIRPIFPRAYELGILLQRILLSFVASIIIYFFAAHLPKTIKKQSMNTIISNAFFKINQLSTNLIYAVYLNTNNDIPKHINNINKEDLLRIITRENMKSPQRYQFDSSEYQDVMELLSAVKTYFNQYYNLIVPYVDLLEENVLVSLNGIINQLYVIHDPVQLLRERTIISPGIYAGIIISLRDNSKKLKI